MGIQDVSLARKLPMLVAGAILVAGVSIGFGTSIVAEDGFRSQAEEKMLALVQARKAALSDYLSGIEQDLAVQSLNPTVLDAVGAFERAYKALPGDVVATLQTAYITENPHPLGEKDKLQSADTGTDYDMVHDRYHGFFRSLLQSRDYYDIFLFDTQGDLVYTVFKELDFATNLMTGKWKNTDLGNVLRRALNADAPVFEDFEAYAPSHGAAASFIANRLTDEDGNVVGVLAFQMPIGRINAVMQQAEGLGESGETYIVGTDGLMRSDSRFSNESSILKTEVDTRTVSSALQGRDGVAIVPDYRGVDVVSAHSFIDFMGTRWAVLAEVDEKEALAPLERMIVTTLMLVGAVLLLGVFVGLGFARALVKPIKASIARMTSLAGGDLDVEVPYRDRGDEVGDMSRAVQVFKEGAIEQRRLEEAERESLERRARRQQEVEGLTKAFDAAVTQMLDNVSSAVDTLHRNSDSLTANAEQTIQQGSDVSVATEQAAQNVEAVSAASTEFSSSIHEISRQIQDTTAILNDAVSQTETANSRISQLADAAARISEVVGLINDIAGQTNLLALNATIEAARAGEAGKGFAVVASEVKNLANQAARATDEISTQIQGIQMETEGAVSAIRDISVIIDQINERSSAVATAVEEQSATTSEIARNVEQAAIGTKSVAGGINEVADAARHTGDMARSVNGAADALKDESDALKNRVRNFLSDVHRVQNQGAIAAE